MIFDEYGVLGQVQPGGWIEGGDSLAWQGAIMALAPHFMAAKGWTIKTYIGFFSVSWGGYVRHPKKKSTYNGFGAYYKSPWQGCISRDQFTGLLGALIYHKARVELLKVFLHHGLRGWLFTYNTIQNGSDPKKKVANFPNITFFNIWSIYVRGFLGWPGIILNTIFDLHGLIDVCIHRRMPDKDPISFAMKRFIEREIYPSPVSYLSWYLLDKEKLKKEIEAYWGTWRQQKGMATFYIRKIDQLCQ